MSKFTLTIGRQTKIESDERISLCVNVPKGTKSYLCINSSECESWAIDGEKPCVHPMQSLDDFSSLGFDEQDYIEACKLKIGGVLNVVDGPFGDYEGIYIMRIS